MTASVSTSFLGALIGLVALVGLSLMVPLYVRHSRHVRAPAPMGGRSA